MPPGEPIVERILAQWVTTLQAIETGENSPYWTDLGVSRVRRWRPGELPQEDDVVVEVKQGPVDNSEALALNGLASPTVMIRTLLKLRPQPDGESVNEDTRMNRLEQDIHRAVMADPTRGGLARDTAWRRSDESSLDEGTNRLVRMVEFAVAYRHVDGQMDVL